jgi:hypothetical protein
VLFAGNDTKLMMNSGKVIFKRTHMDKSLDILVVGVSCMTFAFEFDLDLDLDLDLELQG